MFLEGISTTSGHISDVWWQAVEQFRSSDVKTVFPYCLNGSGSTGVDFGNVAQTSSSDRVVSGDSCIWYYTFEYFPDVNDHISLISSFYRGHFKFL